MTQPTTYSRDTAIGTFWITLGLDRLWHVIWDGEDLGGYRLPEAAARSVALGVGKPASCGDTKRLGLPSDLSMWMSHTPRTSSGPRSED